MLLLSSANFFSKYFFSQKIFHEHYQSVKRCPDKDQRSVCSYLGPNSLQRLSAGNFASMENVNKFGNIVEVLKVCS